MPRRLIRSLLACLVPALLPVTGMAGGGTPLAPFTATYEVSHGSIHAADTVFRLERQRHGDYLFSSRAEAVGLLALFRDDVITETSRFTLHDGRIRALAFNYHHAGSSKNRDQSLRFDWQQGVAYSDYRGEKASIQLKPGMLDHQLLQLAVMRDLAADRLPARYTVLDRNSVKRYQVEKIGTARVETEAGTFETIIVQHEDEGKTTLFWCAPALNYLPVRMEQREPDESTITLELAEYSQLHATQDGADAAG